MASTTHICNLALLRMGEPPILNIDQNTKAAIALKAVFDMCRDIVLVDHPWNFATERAVLAQLSEAPAFGYSYAFQLPTGCLRVLGMVREGNNADPTLEYKIEAGHLLTDESSAKIKYIFQVTDTGAFPPRFVSALAARLAMETAYYLTQNALLAKKAEDQYLKVELPGARSIDAQEDTPTAYEANPWLDARL